MKKLILFFILLISMNLYSQKDYIKYIKGNIPILICAPHGGTIRDNTIQNRDCANVECNSDLNSDKLAIELFTQFLSDTTIYPYLLVNDLHRQELDVNRSKDEAFIDSNVEFYYNLYHNRITNFIYDYIDKSDYILILDIHGQSHDHGYIELGYNIEYKDLANTNLNYNMTSSIQNIRKYNIEELVRGKLSLGSYYDSYYKISPSLKNPIPLTPYFNGGYTTEKYKEYKNVIVIQMELPYSIRKNKQTRDEFVQLTRKVITDFYKIINEND